MLSNRLQELFDEFLCKIKEQFDNVSITGDMGTNQSKIKKNSNTEYNQEDQEVCVKQSKIKKIPNAIGYGYNKEEPREMCVKDSKIKKAPNATEYGEHGYKPEELREMMAKQSKLKKVRNLTNYGNKLEEPNLLEKQPSFLLRKKDLTAGWFSPIQSRSSELRKKYQRNLNKYDRKVDDRIVNVQKKNDERRRKEQLHPKSKNVEPNIEHRNIGKGEKTGDAHFCDTSLKRCTCKGQRTEEANFYDNMLRSSRMPRNQQNFRAEGFGMHPSDYRTKEAPIESLSNFTFNSAYTSSN